MYKCKQVSSLVIEMVHTVCVEVMNAFESDFGEMTDVLFCFHHFGCDFDGSLHECLVRYMSYIHL